MLITTSRKPSPRTRSFAGSLERVLNSKYINRGKMSMRDVLIKSRTSDHTKIAVISEMKGNPSRIKFYNPGGDMILSMDITVSNSLASGKIKKKNLRLRWELDKSNLKDKIISIIEVPEDPVDSIKTGSDTLKEELKQYSNSNLILVKREGSKVVVEFHDQEGHITGPRIYVHRCRPDG